MTAAPASAGSETAAPPSAPAAVSASTGGPYLAPPLPPPPADVRMLVAALVLLGVAILLAWRAARRFRGQAAPAGAQVDQALGRLAAARAEAQGACLCPRQSGGGEPRSSHACADAVRRALADFAQAVTGLPCAALTVQELRAAAAGLPGGAGQALGQAADVLEWCDRCRFAAGCPGAGCLVDAAVAVVAGWPPGSGGPGPRQSTRVGA